MAEADASNNITRKYIYGRGLLSVATHSARYFYHFNGNGNTTALSDINQNIVNSYGYDPFGSVLTQQEAIAQPFKFVGQYGVMAEPNGLYYMRARYYDPSVGRFMSEDPIGFDGGDVNLYAYVLSNPIMNVDPSGLDPISCSVATWKAQQACGPDFNDAWRSAQWRQQWCEESFYYCNGVGDPPCPAPSASQCKQFRTMDWASDARVACLGSPEMNKLFNQSTKCAAAMANLVKICP